LNEFNELTIWPSALDGYTSVLASDMHLRLRFSACTEGETSLESDFVSFLKACSQIDPTHLLRQ